MKDDGPDDVESYQNELSDRVDDGGGCAEMWEALSSERNNQRLPRRSLLRKIGIATGLSSIGLGSVGSASAISGSPTKSTGGRERPDDFGGVTSTDLPDSKRKEAIRTASESSQYAALERRLRTMPYSSPDFSGATVVEVEDPEGDTHLVVGMPLKNDVERSDSSRISTTSASSSASIALGISDDEVVTGRVVLTEQSVGREVRTSIPTSDTPNPEEDISITSTTFSVDGGEVVESTRSATLAPEQIGQPSGRVTTQESDVCWGCLLIGDTICELGCGAATAVICIAAGLAGGGPGIACGLIVGALCSIFLAARDRYAGASCSYDYGVEAACYYADFCADNPLA
jgi:hypothetical protein